RKASSTTVVLAGGKMPTTGSPTTEDIGQAEQFAFRASVVAVESSGVSSRHCLQRPAHRLYLAEGVADDLLGK
ncbi:MAG: hypothetical protein M3305_04510, partial [Actinomycetota bacterium]|nr:hypothetical protein [Actinomycetota bacterium]